MLNKSIGFIGGGRITRIFIERMIETEMLPQTVVVCDTNEKVLDELKTKFPGIEVIAGENKKAAEQDLVFVSLHPPVFVNAIEEIKNAIKPESVIISLAPKISMAKIKEVLNGFERIIRMNPNSPSIIGKGFNPVVYSNSILEMEKKELKILFEIFGESPEVEEPLLETYAVITAMGPTYLQFQFNKLAELALTFGIPETEVKDTLVKMVDGAVSLWANPDYNFEDVYNMVPVKPMVEDEETIKNIYSTKLNAIYNKLKS
jgi:pyrroline-5-carboxylate reductase